MTVKSSDLRVGRSCRSKSNHPELEEDTGVLEIPELLFGIAKQMMHGRFNLLEHTARCRLDQLCTFAMGDLDQTHAPQVLQVASE